MQLKKFYNKPTKVNSRKSAITFVDQPDCLDACHCVLIIWLKWELDFDIWFEY